jgi:hypothetical protein
VLALQDNVGGAEKNGVTSVGLSRQCWGAEKSSRSSPRATKIKEKKTLYIHATLIELSFK